LAKPKKLLDILPVNTELAKIKRWQQTAASAL
jgi:hypothetical protein